MTISSPAQARERTRMRVASLRPSDRNPRTISKSRFENLKRSLEQDREFLDARPLLVNSYPGRENIVIAGNMRLRAAQELGWDEVPVLVVSLPPEVEARWNLKDNNQWGEYVDQDLEPARSLLLDVAHLEQSRHQQRGEALLAIARSGIW